MRCWIALHISITIEAGQDLWEPAAVQQAVASVALGFSPRVTLLDEAVLVDVTGSLRLFGDLTRLTQLLQARLLDFFESNQAIAHINQRYGATSLIAIARLRQQLDGPGATAKTRVANLPMHTLSAARPHLGVLERIGCRTWDDLLRLPRDGVARRFGAELLEALDRARGAVADDYPWQTLPDQFEEKIELEALVVHAPALMAGVQRLLTRLQAWLLGRQSGLSALRLIWHLDKRKDVPPTGELEIRTAQPAQALQHVARLVAEHLARHQLAAPVHSLSLLSLVTEPLGDAADATASLLMKEGKQGGSLVELIERLSARLGEAQVQAWQPAADHRPERMQRWVPAQNAIKSIAISTDIKRARGKKDLKTLPFSDNNRVEALYPSWLLPEPLRLAVTGNNPLYQGRLLRLAGPQRLEATGWLALTEDAHQAHARRQTPPAMRDYYIYRNERGSLLWIYSVRLVLPDTQAPLQAQRHDWYLHGFFA
ncbi:MAG: hypothetical protein JWP47_2633 [Polaromonas sp.]|jgi:protein ImuB|nr:hypothetical protein [Polaromonas sp.]